MDTRTYFTEEPYHKIQTLWKRDPKTNYKTLISGEWALPVFHYLKDISWQCYEKIDGTNVRVSYFKDPLLQSEEVTFAGRKDLKDKNGFYRMPNFHPGLWDHLLSTFTTQFFQDNFDMGRFGESEYVSICLYGEGFGEKIQGGGNYGKQNFCLFDVKINGIWMEQAFVSELAQQAGLPRAPLAYANCSLETAIHIAWTGFKSILGAELTGKEFGAEGLIVRPPVELADRFGNRIIGKIKHKDFTNVAK